ncbi:hypothetical protein EVAR_80566_1 [Eumeta japonica]|uniref:Uncharacterized protein n=1 Tax=Eumeta variegata TaxID=151549 RepID=A0A4C1TLK7_EUMVA|nr:hypothetical protein EVAR_80566_1 [Eumeta japonica]
MFRLKGNNFRVRAAKDRQYSSAGPRAAGRALEWRCLPNSGPLVGAELFYALARSFMRVRRSTEILYFRVLRPYASGAYSYILPRYLDESTLKGFTWISGQSIGYPPSTSTSNRSAGGIYKVYRATIPRSDSCCSKPAERKEKEEDKKTKGAQGVEKAGRREEEEVKLAAQNCNLSNNITSATTSGIFLLIPSAAVIVFDRQKSSPPSLQFPI